MAIRLTLQPWLFLLAAVTSEVVGVSTMKLVAQEHDWGALLFMYAMIGLSFAFLAMAMKQMWPMPPGRLWDCWRLRSSATATSEKA